MNESSFQNTGIIDIDEQMKKDEELFNTIRMEPILEKTVILEEPIIKKKEKRVQFVDYFLMSLIVILGAAFFMVILKIF